MKTLTCNHEVARELTELCQHLVARDGFGEAYDTEPRVAFQRLFLGAALRSPAQFEMYSPEGNAACVRAFELVLAHPEVVNLFGLNRDVVERLRVGPS